CIAHDERAIAVLDFHRAMDAVDVDAAITVADIQRSIGRHCNVVIYGPGRMLAEMKPSVFFGWIDRADTDARGRLLHFNLNFLREGLGFLMRTSLSADDRGDFDFVPGFAVDLDFSKFVFDADGLARA